MTQFAFVCLSALLKLGSDRVITFSRHRQTRTSTKQNKKRPHAEARPEVGALGESAEKDCSWESFVVYLLLCALRVSREESDQTHARSLSFPVSRFPMLYWSEIDNRMHLLTEPFRKACCAIAEYRFQHVLDPEPVNQKT